MEQSPDIKELSVALVKAQAEFEPAIKESLNPHLKTKYANLASVLKAVNEPLVKNNLAVVQLIESTDPTGVRLTTQLMHVSGQWCRSTGFLPSSKQDPQGHGAALSYLRRYALSAMLGIYQEDDDADSAMVHPAKNPTTPSKVVENIKTAVAQANSTPPATKR